MKVSVKSAALLAGTISGVFAFPQLMTSSDSPLARRSIDAALEKRQSSPPQGAGALPATPPPFNAAAQYVSTTGQYAFVAPGPSDSRGPCPGLNAMANHGYLPHNGSATIAQFIQATYQVFGMAQDLSTFLANYGALVEGNGASWLIGGVPHTGIGGSHGNYETDSSPLKSDLNQYGKNYELVMSQFYDLYNRQPNAATANYNLEVLRDFRADRFNQSVNENPYFVYGPFTGIAVSQAAFTFIYRFMANKSAEYPEGILNQNVLKSFMSISGSGSNMTWVPGNERIPNNWYKRNDADQYSIPYFATDVNYFAEKYPQIVSTGCNEGKVNSYQQFSAAALTNGAYSAATVAQNPLCYALEFGYAAAVSGAGYNSAQAAAVANTFAKGISALGVKCANITNPNFSYFTACPGFTNYGGPTGPIAPGAIQN